MYVCILYKIIMPWRGQIHWHTQTCIVRQYRMSMLTKACHSSCNEPVQYTGTTKRFDLLVPQFHLFLYLNKYILSVVPKHLPLLSYYVSSCVAVVSIVVQLSRCTCVFVWVPNQQEQACTTNLPMVQRRKKQ